MKNVVIAALFACVFSGLVSADQRNASAEDSREVALLRQQALDLGDAMVAGDIDKISQIFAEDWKGIAISGKLTTRESVIANVKSGKDKLESFVLGPMNIQVIGNIAMVQGSVTEKRSWDGKDTSGQFIWMDIVEKRDGKWVIIRSAGARVK